MTKLYTLHFRHKHAYSCFALSDAGLTSSARFNSAREFSAPKIFLYFYRRAQALECIMSNQGKMERNSKVCKEVQNDEKYSWHAINFGFFICAQRCGRKNLERMAVVEIILLKRVSAIHFL